MNKTVKKSLIVTSITLGSIAGLFLLLYAVLAIIGCAMYGEARKLREKVCTIPALGSGFAPQGITYAESEDVYIQTGYGSDNLTHLYIVRGKESRKVELTDTEGAPLKGHAGGVTCTKNKVYIANGANLIMFELDELIDAGTNAVAPSRVYPVDNNSAYCYSDDNNIYVGEFYRAGNYETEVHHHFTTPSGAENKAIVSCYALDENGEIKMTDGDRAYPEYCISVTGLVQGFAAQSGRHGTIVLSRSYGLKNSALDYHMPPQDSGKTIEVKFKNDKDAPQKAVPLYYIDDTTLFGSLTLPAFGEDITIVNDRVVVTNEASANKYVVGKLFGANKVYSYPLYTVNID